MSLAKLIMVSVITLLSFPSYAEKNPEFPSKPSLVPDKIFNVKRQNWKTFSLSCKSLDRNITTYIGRDRWGIMFGEVEGKSDWDECLNDIKNVKKQLKIFRKEIKIVKKLASEISIKENKIFPLDSILRAISNHINNIKPLDKKTIYAIDVFNYHYIAFQVVTDQQVLFIDQENTYPPILLNINKGLIVKERTPISNYADYFTYDGITEYTNSMGFKRQAIVLTGHKSNNGFREAYIKAAKAYQWIDGDVNTKGM